MKILYKGKNNLSWDTSAFTLIELIIVIVILAILWTISFISYQNYGVSARDSVRLSDVKIIEKWLRVYVVWEWAYPIPDDKFKIKADWQTIWYQWIIGNKVTGKIWLSTLPRDPSFNNNYIYSLNSRKNIYWILSIFEWDF